MTAKICLFSLVGFAMFVCTFTATCRVPKRFKAGYDMNTMNTLKGTWYVQGLYMRDTSFEDEQQLFCYKAENEMKGGELHMTSTVKAFCSKESFTSLIRFVLIKRTGELEGYQDNWKDPRKCYFITLDGESYLTIYCCDEREGDVIEFLALYTRNLSLDLKLIARMYDEATDAGLGDLAVQLEYLSQKHCRN